MPDLIYLAGYSAGNGRYRKPSTLLARAEELGASIFDIRMRPGSKFKEWNKYNLMTLMGCRYQWVPWFGNIAVGTGDIVINEYDTGLRILRSHFKALHRPVILVCACRSVHSCHRGVVGKMLERESDCQEFVIQELDWQAPVLPLQRALEMKVSR